MSEKDKVAIEIVERLQGRIQKWVISMVGIFALALLTAVFWGGALDNQVDTNTENIKDLSELVREFVTEQKVYNENVMTEDDARDIKQLLERTKENLNHLSFWAESKGYRPKTRLGDSSSIKD